MKDCWKLVVLLCGSLALAACGSAEGPPTYRVSGKVTLDGNPLPQGDIVFRAADGQGRSDAGKIKDGQYAFEATAGKKQVSITAHHEVPGKFDESNPGENPGDEMVKVPMTEQYLPAQYNAQTTLEAEVTDSEEQNTFNFELTSEKAP